MKYTTILFVLFLLGTTVKAQSNNDEISNKMNMWVSYGSTSFGSVLQFQMYAKRSSWGLGQQFFAANVRNTTMYKLHITGELYAKLICGNESVSRLDFIIDKYESLQKAEMGALNTSFLSDATGLISSAEMETCKGEDIIIGGKKYGVNRIKSLGYRNLKVLAQMGEGGDWVQMNSQGGLIEKPKSNVAVQKNETNNNRPPVTSVVQNKPNSSIINQPQTTSLANSNVADTKTNERQQYQNQANYYLGLAQNTNQSGISQQLNLNLAGVNAYMSGNTQQMQQIQQQQNYLNQQRSEQLAQSTANLVGSVFNLIESNQQRKLEMQQRMQESERQWRAEESRKKRIVEEVEKELEPVKQQSLEFLKQGIDLDSTAYVSSTDVMDKVCISSSWWFKKAEIDSIEKSAPDVYVFSDGSYKVNSTGRIVPSAIALLDCRSLADSFALQGLQPKYYASAKDFLYTVDLPYKAEKNFNKTLKFLYSNNKSVDILYSKAKRSAETSYGKSYVPSELADLDKLNYKSAPNNYGDFTHVYNYYKGHGWRAIYGGGYRAFKKLDAMRILGNIILDSAVSKQDISIVYRAAFQYSKAFRYYNDNFGKIASLKTHPVQLLNKLFLNYSAAIMILKKETAGGNSVDTSTSLEYMKQYLSDFENYRTLVKEKVL